MLVGEDKHLRVRFAELFNHPASDPLDHIGDPADGDGDFIVECRIGLIGIGHHAGDIPYTQQNDNLVDVVVPIETLVVQKHQGVHFICIIEVQIGDRKDM